MTALVLTKDESVNIGQCLSSLGWCEQLVVIDSGSTDDTAAAAAALGAEVVHQPWLGFAAQREHALRLDVVRNDWVYFIDADEWVSARLAAEVADAMAGHLVAYRQRLRLVFLGRWIAHCGWYRGAWVVRLGRRSCLSFAHYDAYGERAAVEGPIGVLHYDIVDQDHKGLGAWLRKHVSYAEAEAERRALASAPFRSRSTRWLRGERGGRLPARSLAKDVVFPALPARPLLLFGYMYVLKAGFRDGRAGLVFCLLHAWHEMVIGQLSASRVIADSKARYGSPARP